MKWRSLSPVLLALLLGIWSCSPVRLVKPLEEGEFQLSGSLGGPLIGFAGALIPIPLSSLSAAYGVNNNVSATVGIHATSAAFGVFQADLGAVWGMDLDRKYWKGISALTQLNVMTDRWENNWRVFPQVDLNCWWEYGDGNMPYAGISSWFDFHQMPDNPVDNQQLIPSLHIGHLWNRSKWSFGPEVKWISPYTPSDNVVVDYRSPGGLGAIGVYFSINRTFK